MSVLVRKAPKFKLFRMIEGELSEDPNVHVLSMTATSGGSRSYSAIVEITNPDTPSGGIQSTTRYVDRQLISLTVGEWGWIFFEATPGADLVLCFAGYVLASPVSLTPEGEPEKLEIRYDSWRMGQVAQSPYSADNGGIVTSDCDLPLVFNPIVDGRVVPNKFEDYLWHPNAPPPTGETLVAWDAYDAIVFLTTKFQFDSSTFDLDFSDIEVLIDQTLSDVKIDRGMGLAEAFDHILLPLGYDWSFTPIDNLDETFSLHLRAWSRNTGFEKLDDDVLTMTEYTSQSSLVLAPFVSHVRGQVDLASNSANQFEILGDFIRKEGTFELIPAWDLTIEDEDLSRYQADSEYWQTDARYARVFRDYVLNEDNSYDGDSFDVSDFFGTEEVPRKRRFYPCLSLGNDGKPFGREKGYHIEMFDGFAWIPFTAPMDILLNECGIRITSSVIRPTLRARLQIRITAVLESDHRVKVNSGALASNLTETKLMVIDTKERFKKHTRDAGSVLSSLPSAATDDTAVMELYLDQIAASYAKHQMELSITINRVDFIPSNIVGLRVEKIGNHTGGRMLGLASNPGLTSFPVITAVLMDIQEQTTTLMLDGKTR